MSTDPSSRIDVVILAGGLGTRLQSVVSDVPKPLAPVNGRPFVDYQFALLQASPLVGRVVLAIGHLADRVIAHYAAHEPSLDLAFAVETSPLGTAGALRHALPFTTSPRLFVLNGDSIFHWDIAALDAAHRAAGAQATIALLEVEDVSRYGAVTLDKGKVSAFHEKSSHARAGTINAGAYLFEREAIARIPEHQAVSLERDVLPRLAAAGSLAGVPFQSDFIDIGLPETYRLAASFIPKLFAQR